LIFQYPQPVQADLSFRYDNKYFEYEIDNEEIFFGLMLKTLKDIDFNKQTTDMMKDGPEILDVGCATGMLLKHMESLGWQGRGVELCTSSAAYGRQERKLSIFNGTLTEAGYSDNQFSVIHSSHLIEHLTNPSDYISEALRILKPGGLLITTTPNTSSFQRWLLGRNWRSAIADHMFLFSVRTLSSLLLSEGFEIVITKTWGGIAVGMAPGFIKKPLDFLAKKFGFGDVVVILARKKD
jgi:2-polyprenyl-3-methyl-5-hydroxy-6-metoxy-1,4-benzoquinol methylase